MAAGAAHGSAVTDLRDAGYARDRETLADPVTIAAPQMAIASPAQELTGNSTVPPRRQNRDEV